MQSNLRRGYRTLSRTSYVSPFFRALVYAGLGDRSRSLDWLERAYEERSSWMSYLAVEREFEPFRADPRFRTLLRRVGVNATP